MDSGKSVDARLFGLMRFPSYEFLGMNKRNKISSEMYHRAVVKGRRCGPHAGECPRPRELTGVFFLFFIFFTAHKDIRRSDVDIKISMKYS